jgi:hypothetical protein
MTGSLILAGAGVRIGWQAELLVPTRILVIAGHDRPRTAKDGDPRLTFLGADWPVEDTGPHNDDSGRKKHALNDFVLGRGGGPFIAPRRR